MSGQKTNCIIINNNNNFNVNIGKHKVISVTILTRLEVSRSPAQGDELLVGKPPQIPSCFFLQCLLVEMLLEA